MSYCDIGKTFFFILSQTIPVILKYIMREKKTHGKISNSVDSLAVGNE